jgi:hypothetical protein
MNPKNLPIYELRDELIAALRTENRLIIEAPTGSGEISSSSSRGAKTQVGAISSKTSERAVPMVGKSPRLQ